MPNNLEPASLDLPKIDLPRKPHYITLHSQNSADDFLVLFKKIEKRYQTCFLLESLGEEGDMSRYSLIGFDPAQIISAIDNTLFIRTYTQKGLEQSILEKEEQFISDNPYALLQKIVPQNIISKKYAGGLTGYLAYDCINYFENKLKVKTSDLFEAFKFGVYKDGLIFDKMTGELIYFYYQNNRLEQIKALIAEDYIGNGALKVKYLGDTMTQEQHAQAVEKVKQNIINGLVFQCEVGFKSRYELTGDTINIYEQLRIVNPSPHMYYLKFNDERIIGASPELLFRLRQGEMETYPLAGTTKRGATPKEDRELARALLNDPKEVAEHNMLIDLHRNDIGKVAKFGTVKVRNMMNIKRFSHVQHISSEIVGIIKDSEDMFSALASNFPAGTLSGAPKIEAIKIIDAMEVDARGPYGGAVGCFSFNGDCTFAIPIRTIFSKGKAAYVQTSGGNVYDSVAQSEYEEIQRKLAGTRKVLDLFRD
ncbi:aminodeoxychorismate synthase subunit I [Gammaproteobacteria bacterium]|nr:aminodeoxychorismate synthase subunit I [Gammaproteobacteria bacterium]